MIMGKLSDEKLAKLITLNSQGGFWYITKQNLVFRDLCYMAKILEAWNDRKEENYESFFYKHNTLPEYGSLDSSVAHRATKNCEYIGLTFPSDKYSAKNLTPFYFALKKLCGGNFYQLSLYPQIIDKQLERMFIDSKTNSTYTVNFQICPFMFLFKVLLIIGDLTKSYKISRNEFVLFVATAQNWSEYFEVVESILRYRSDITYKTECDKNLTKVSDVRYNILAQNHSQFTVSSSEIAITEQDVRSARRKVAEYELSDRILSADDIFTVDTIIDEPKQIIFYGAPGTSKSHTIKETTEKIEEETKQNGEGARVFRTTFHPDSDYSTFVGCYKPCMRPIPQTYIVEGEEKPVKGSDGQQVTKKEIVYSFIPQSFTNAYIRAWQTDKPVYLVIEEINRGNCAQIFGDLFQLLDRKNNISEYPIQPDADLGNYLKEQLESKHRDDTPEEIFKGEKLCLPSNLYIWASMNTSDQSLFPIDSAFKRRWDWKYMKITNMDGKVDHPYKIIVNGKEYQWWVFVDKMNNHIGSSTSSEDKKLGYFFIHREDGVISADDFVSKVLFYLYNDALKDYSVPLKVKKDDELKTASFSDFYDEEGKVLEDKVIEALDDFLKVEKKETAEDQQ